MINHKILVSGGILALILLSNYTCITTVSAGSVEEGNYEIFLVKLMIETTSDYTTVFMRQGFRYALANRTVIQGSDEPGFEYYYIGFDNYISKVSSLENKIILEVQALVLEGSPVAEFMIYKGGMGYTKVTLYVYDPDSGSYNFIDEYTEGPGDSRIPFQMDLTQLYDCPAANATIERVSQVERSVMSFYYQWYLSPEGPSGQTFHWDEGYTNTPLLGLYDCLDENVIRAQLALAKYAGIDTLIADYPYRDEAQRDSWPIILAVAEELGINVTHYGLRGIHLSEAEQFIQYKPFLKHSGEPVFFFYNAGQVNPEDWLDYKETVEEALGPVIWIGGTTDDAYLGVFEGFHTYVYITGYPEDNGIDYYTEMIDSLSIGPRSTSILETFDKVRRGEDIELELKMVCVTVVPGYDDTKVRSPGLQRDREDGALYRRLWNTAGELGAQLVLITSWNEWHEGTEIEPSVEHGFMYLNLTRELIEEYKGETVQIPESSFTATLDHLVQYPDLSGQGAIEIRAEGAPPINLEITINSDDFTEIELSGQYYTYIHEESSQNARVLIPSIKPGHTLEIQLSYRANVDEPNISINIESYDVVGNRVEIFSEAVTPSLYISPTITLTDYSEYIELGQELIISGMLEPISGVQSINITFNGPDDYLYSDTFTTEEDGGFSYTYTPDSPGLWETRLYYQDDIGYSETESKVFNTEVAEPAEPEPEPEPEPELEPEPEPKEPEKKPGGIPGFPLESLLIGLVIAFLFLWYLRN